MAVNWKGMRVLVTGADGFLGSWLTKRLTEKGAEVTVLLRDRKHESRLRMFGLLDKVNRAYGGVEEQGVSARVLNEYNIQLCIHLAAQTLVGIANRSPLSTFESNIKGTWNVLEAARELKTGSVIIASSDKAYGDHEKLPYTEKFCLQGKHPYDVSKSCADLLAQAYAETYGMNIAITRCGNIYGGGDMNWSRIVPGTIRSLLNNETPIIRSDGTLVRDYLYVEDVVDGYILLAEAMQEKHMNGEAFNFGTNNPLSVLDMAKRIGEAAGMKDIRPQVMGEAPNEILRQYLDSSKARQHLGWAPKHTLPQGLKKTYAWYRKHAA